MNKNPNKTLIVIIFTIFVDLLGFGLLIPIFPALFANPQSPYYLLSGNNSLREGYILLGYLMAAFPIMVFLAAPIFGQLSDKYGRKKILIIALLGTTFSYALFAVGLILRNIPLLFVARAIDGLSGSSISTAQASVADITKPEDRAKNFGLIGAAFGLGFIIGPYAGGKLSDPAVISWFDATTPFWFAAILGVINVITVLLVFKETNPYPKPKLALNFAQSFYNIAKAFRIRQLQALFLTNFFYQGGFSFFVTFFAVFLVFRFHFTQGNIGDYFSYVGIWAVITQAFILPIISRKISEIQIIRLSLFFLSFLIFITLFPTKVWQLLLITPVFSLANGLSQANTLALISKSANRERQGEILGINASVISLAQSIPPIISGYLAAKFTAETPILVASITIFIAWLIFILFLKKKS